MVSALAGDEPLDLAAAGVDAARVLDLLASELRESSCTMPAITSADRLAPPAMTFWIEPRISSPAVPFTR